jgi:hypothetical protein
MAVLLMGYASVRRGRYEIHHMGNYLLTFDNWTGGGCILGGQTCFDVKGNWLDDKAAQNQRKQNPLDSLLQNLPADSQ